MAEKKELDPNLVRVGKMLTKKRKSLGEAYKAREEFIYNRQNEIFGGEDWISYRHLINIELGKNWISIEKLILLAAALEEDPVDLFRDIYYEYIRKE